MAGDSQVSLSVGSGRITQEPTEKVTSTMASTKKISTPKKPNRNGSNKPKSSKSSSTGIRKKGRSAKEYGMIQVEVYEEEVFYIRGEDYYYHRVRGFPKDKQYDPELNFSLPGIPTITFSDVKRPIRLTREEILLLNELREVSGSDMPQVRVPAKDIPAEQAEWELAMEVIEQKYAWFLDEKHAGAKKRLGVAEYWE